MRQSGILMHITSLPGPYGIGSLGAAAYDFVDFLKAAGQSCWQILPVNPTGYGDSPYSAFSSVAGNPYLIDLEQLIDEGLLLRQEDETDRRTVHLKLTPQAFRAAEAGREAQRAFFDRIHAGISPQEIAVWRSMGEKISENIKRLEE